MPAPCASAEMLATKELKSPPQRAAWEGVLRRRAQETTTRRNLSMFDSSPRATIGIMPCDTRERQSRAHQRLVKRVLFRFIVLSRDVSHKCAGRLDLPAQPAWSGVEAVRPGRRAIFEEYAREKRGIAQRLSHWTARGNQTREIVLARRAVAERRVQAMAAEAFEFGDLNHRRVLRREPPPQPSPASGRGSALPLP